MKEKFIKSTIILMFGGIITKILAMIIRIATTRVIGLEGIGLYMLIMPTFSLFITIATLSLPVAISKLVSEETRNNKNIVLGIIPIALLFNIILIIILYFLAPLISNNLLQNKNLYYPILAIGITLPFITLSSIIRGYFFGKQKMFPQVVSNTFEQIIRLLIIILALPYILKLGLIPAVTSLILLNVISELSSIIILIFFIPKNLKITKKDIKQDTTNIKDTLSISIPTTAGRMISSIAQFLEPIILTFILLKLGFTNNFITNQYGIISGYVLPMVMFPQFLSGAISSSLLPVISKYNAQNNKKAIRSKAKQAIIFCLSLGIPITLILFFFPELCLKLMFNTTTGHEYLKITSLLFLISYITGPINAVLQAMNESKTVMISNLIGNIIKTLILILLLYLKLNMYALLFSYFIQYIAMTIYQAKKIKNLLN